MQKVEIMGIDKEKKRKRRALTVANILDRKTEMRTVTGDNRMNELLGWNVELRGFWIVYGKEKNGKTTFALKLADAIAQGGERVVYVSAEEGCGGTFAAALRRSGLGRETRRITIEEYMSMGEVIEYYRSGQKPRVIVIDNVKSYETEFRRDRGLLHELRTKMKNKLLIFIAHERENRAYPRVAEDIKLLANVVVHVKGLVGTVVSRYEGGGGEYVIAHAAEKYHGSSVFSQAIDEYDEADLNDD